jgi:two-component system chemotaxis response regulator CheY
MRLDLSLPVLVVDDFTTMTKIICNILKQIGFQNVDMVHSGNEALAKLRAQKYSLVISDWNMESMSGYDLLKEIRSDEKLANVCFIMISAEASISHVVEARNAHADSYVVKPFNAQSLKAKIEEAFTNRRTSGGSFHQPATKPPVAGAAQQ